MGNKTRKNRICVNIEDEMMEVLNIIRKISSDSSVVGKLVYVLLKEGLFSFLDEVDCDLSTIDRDLKHFSVRVNCGIISKQFDQAKKINKCKEVRNG